MLLSLLHKSGTLSSSFELSNALKNASVSLRVGNAEGKTVGSVEGQVEGYQVGKDDGFEVGEVLG